MREGLRAIRRLFGRRERQREFDQSKTKARSLTAETATPTLYQYVTTLDQLKKHIFGARSIHGTADKLRLLPTPEIPNSKPQTQTQNPKTPKPRSIHGTTDRHRPSVWGGGGHAGVRARACVRVCACACACVSVGARVCAGASACVLSNMCLCVRCSARACTHARAHTHTHTHTQATAEAGPGGEMVGNIRGDFCADSAAVPSI